MLTRFGPEGAWPESPAQRRRENAGLAKLPAKR
jgi:hypothetical protein